MAQNRVKAEVNSAPGSRVEVQASFDLVYLDVRSPSTETGTTLEIAPYIQVILPRPLPPLGYLGPVYDIFLRDHQEQVYQLFPGKATKQQKRTAIWTWALGLLVASGEDFYPARSDVEERTKLHAPDKHPTRQWFEKSRRNLLVRVPEAEDCMYLRERRSKTQPPP